MASALVALAVAGIVGAAVVDALRGDGEPPAPAPVADPAEAAGALQELGVAGRLLYADPACRVRARSLPDLEQVEPGAVEDGCELPPSAEPLRVDGGGGLAAPSGEQVVSSLELRRAALRDPASAPAGLAALDVREAVRPQAGLAVVVLRIRLDPRLDLPTSDAVAVFRGGRHAATYTRPRLRVDGLAVSPDARFLAAATSGEVVVAPLAGLDRAVRVALPARDVAWAREGGELAQALHALDLGATEPVPRPVPALPLEALLAAAAEHPATPASRRVSGVDVLEAGWLDRDTVAALLLIHYPDGRLLPQRLVAAFVDGALAWARPVPPAG